MNRDDFENERRTKPQCAICLYFDDINDQPECLCCENGSNFVNTLPEKAPLPSLKPSNDALPSGIVITECILCGETKVCQTIKNDFYVIDVCPECLSGRNIGRRQNEQ